MTTTHVTTRLGDPRLREYPAIAAVRRPSHNRGGSDRYSILKVPLGDAAYCPDRGSGAGVAGSLVALEGLVGGLDIALPPVWLAS